MAVLLDTLSFLTDDTWGQVDVEFLRNFESLSLADDQVLR